MTGDEADTRQKQGKARAGDEIGEQRSGEPAHAEHDTALFMAGLMRIGGRYRVEIGKHRGEARKGRHTRSERRVIVGFRFRCL